MGSNHCSDVPGDFIQADAGPKSGGNSSSQGFDPPATQSSCDNSRRLHNMSTPQNNTCQNSNSAENKKRLPKINGGGLRQFSLIVCKKIEAKGRTTYNEVADEIIVDFLATESGAGNSNMFDEKNIRRRVYDAFNVLMAINIIAKDKKEIRWIGFPDKMKEFQGLLEERVKLVNNVQKKFNYLRELEDQCADVQNLMLRNKQLHESGNATSGEIALPFILVQTGPQATVEIEISEDMQFVHFDFNGTPFLLHTDAQVLQAMRCRRTAKPLDVQGSYPDHSSSVAVCGNNGTRGCQTTELRPAPGRSEFSTSITSRRRKASGTTFAGVVNR